MNVPVFLVWLNLCSGLIHIVNASDNSVVDELRKEIAELKATTTETATALRNTENDIQSHRAETAETATALRKAENEIQTLRAEIEEMKLEKQKPKKDGKRFVLANPFAEKPAFSAGLSKSAMNLGNYQTIVFEKVFTNDLGAYSPVTGFFTVPMNGTYFFTATVMSHSGQHLETEISLNGQSLVYMYSYDTQYEQGTNSVVLALKAGDSVCVRHQGNEGSNALGGNWSTFSGFMI